MAHQWRGVVREYADRLPVTDATPVVSLREGGTPLVYACVLSEMTGCEVWIKVEGANDIVTATAYGSAPWSSTGRKSVIPAFTGATANAPEVPWVALDEAPKAGSRVAAAGGWLATTVLLDSGETLHTARYSEVAEDVRTAYRGLFLIDQKGIVRHQLVNDLPLGRNVDEALRMVDALQFFEKHGEVCPANWTPGAATIDTKNASAYFEKAAAGK